MAKKHKEPLQLKEDTLEVGLERYRKADRNRASWLLLNAPWILIGALVLIVVGPLWLMGGGSDSPPGTPSARLKAGEPTMVWVEGSTSQLRSVRVSVANTSAVNATGVKVVALIRGKSFDLAGPDLITSGEGEVFSGPAETVFRSGDAVEIVPSCSNCR